MGRRRWFAVDWRTPMPEIARVLKAHPFQEEKGDGFVLEQVRPSFVSGSYYERKSHIEAMRDPFGHETNFERVEYRRSEFIISEGQLGLEMVEPSRSSQGLLNKLSEATDFRLTLVPITVNPHKWAMALQNRGYSSSFVESMQFSGIRLNVETAATLLVKGKQDVFRMAQSMIGEMPNKVDKVVLRLDHARSSVTLSSTGLAVMKCPYESEVLPDVRSALLDAFASSA